MGPAADAKAFIDCGFREFGPGWFWCWAIWWTTVDGWGHQDLAELAAALKSNGIPLVVAWQS